MMFARLSRASGLSHTSPQALLPLLADHVPGVHFDSWLRFSLGWRHENIGLKLIPRKVILSRELPGLCIPWRPNLLYVLDRPVEISHTQQPHRQAMRNDDNVLYGLASSVEPVDVTKHGLEKECCSSVQVRARFSP